MPFPQKRLLQRDGLRGEQFVVAAADSVPVEVEYEPRSEGLVFVCPGFGAEVCTLVVAGFFGALEDAGEGDVE